MTSCLPPTTAPRMNRPSRADRADAVEPDTVTMASGSAAPVPAARTTPLMLPCDQPGAEIAMHNTTDNGTAEHCGNQLAWRHRHMRRLPCLYIPAYNSRLNVNALCYSHTSHLKCETRDDVGPSLGAERDYQIDSCGAPRAYAARREGDHTEPKRYRGQCHGVGRRHAEELASNEPSRAEGSDQSQYNRDEHHAPSLCQNHSRTMIRLPMADSCGHARRASSSGGGTACCFPRPARYMCTVWDARDAAAGFTTKEETCLTRDAPRWRLH